MKNDVIITGFSNPTSEGVILHLNKTSTLKTGNVANNKFWVSWDKIGKLLFDGYTDATEVSERNELKKMTFETEYDLKELKEELSELFDENGKRYTGVILSNRQAELMNALILKLEKECESLSDQLNFLRHAKQLIIKGYFE